MSKNLNVSDYLKIYNQKLQEGETRRTAFTATVNLFLSEVPGSSLVFSWKSKMLKECTEDPELSYLNFLKDLLSPNGDIGKLLGAYRGTYTAIFDDSRTPILDIPVMILQLLPGFDPLETKNLLLEYYWFPTLKELISKTGPITDAELGWHGISRVAAFDKTLEHASIFVSSSILSGGVKIQDRTYNNCLENKIRIEMIAEMIGLQIPDLKKNHIFENVSACEKALKEPITNLQKQKILEALEVLRKTAPAKKELYASEYQRDYRRPLNTRITSVGEIVSRVAVMGLATAGVLYLYKLSKK